MRQWFLPAVIFIFGLLSLLVLESIAPQLAPRQFIFFVLGFVIFYSVSKIPFSNLEKMSWLGYALTCALLVLAQIIAFQTRSTISWIYVGDLFAIQPSQLAIPLVGLFLSYQASQKDTQRLSTFARILLLMIGPAVLILKEPDLGTAVIYLCSILSILFFAKTKWQYWAGLAAVGIVAIFLSWQFVLRDYQKERVTSFLDGSDLKGASYNAQQSLIAVGSGQLWGRGLGQGVQSHLRFLPERQTDFIFASAAEEFGFFGSLLIIGLYAGLIIFLLLTAIRTDSPTAFLFCMMAAASLLLQAGINISMNMGMVPITGITLPLISYGGSSLLSTCGLLGIVQTIVNEQKSKAAFHIE